MADRAQNTKDLLTLYKAVMVELPVAGAKATLGVVKDGEIEGTAWKAYDAWIRLVNRSTDALYQNPFFGDGLGRSLPGMLQTQRFTGAVSEAAFAVLRTVTGLAGASEVQAVRAELRDLRLELRSLIAGLVEHEASSEQTETPRDLEVEEEFIRTLDGRLQLARRGKAKAA